MCARPASGVHEGEGRLQVANYTSLLRLCIEVALQLCCTVLAHLSYNNHFQCMMQLLLQSSCNDTMNLVSQASLSPHPLREGEWVWREAGPARKTTQNLLDPEVNSLNSQKLPDCFTTHEWLGNGVMGLKPTTKCCLFATIKVTVNGHRDNLPWFRVTI